MKRLLLFVLPLALAGPAPVAEEIVPVLVADAEAVSWGYCSDSLRGRTGLASDHDIYIEARRIESATGRNVVDYRHAWWDDASGSYTVHEAVQFQFANGEWSSARSFYCSGSGSTYSDGRNW